MWKDIIKRVTWHQLWLSTKQLFIRAWNIFAFIALTAVAVGLWDDPYEIRKMWPIFAVPFGMAMFSLWVEAIESLVFIWRMRRRLNKAKLLQAVMDQYQKETGH
jgi:hypothetical protein